MNTWRGKCNQELQGRTIDYSPGYIYILVFLYIAISIDLGQLVQIKNNDNKCKNAGEVSRGAIRSYREFLFYTGTIRKSVQWKHLLLWQI